MKIFRPAGAVHGHGMLNWKTLSIKIKYIYSAEEKVSEEIT